MKRKFLTTLLMSPLPDGRRWRLEAPFSFISRGGTLVTAPTGFDTDLASIPRVAWIGGALIALGLFCELLSNWPNLADLTVALGFLFVFLSPFLRHDGKYTSAAVLHDWMYRTRWLPRWQCDWLLLEMMTVLGVSWWQRWLIFLNVRAFGWLAWRNQKRWRKQP